MLPTVSSEQLWVKQHGGTRDALELRYDCCTHCRHATRMRVRCMKVGADIQLGER